MPRPTLPKPPAGYLRLFGTLRGREADAAVAALMLALMTTWAVHDGGYDNDTWYWGGLLLLAALITLLARGVNFARPPRLALLAGGALAAYAAFSYLSIAWSGSPGDALNGSNRALLYGLVFWVMLAIPWRTRGALALVVLFALAVDVIGIVLLIRLASRHDIGALVNGGRLAAPTGYFNATAALFTIAGLLSLGVSARRDLSLLIRAPLVAMGAGALQLAVVCQSRGWLFTLPVVLALVLLLLRDRIRVLLAALPVAAVAALNAHLLVAVFDDGSPRGLAVAAGHAGTAALIGCAAVLIVSAVVLAGAQRLKAPQAPPAGLRALRLIGVLFVLALAAGGVTAATHGHPLRFAERQWNGFTTPTNYAVSTGSHFNTVGSGRYDFWRVSLNAFAAHPLGGLGQDNFSAYYITRRHTTEVPSWTHSLEMRLLAHTGIVGFALFAVFLGLALRVAVTARRSAGPLRSGVTGLLLIPLVVWLVHGSIDWFWEVPALTAPALGFLAVAMALAGQPTGPPRAPSALAETGAPAAAGSFAPPGLTFGPAAPRSAHSKRGARLPRGIRSGAMVAAGLAGTIVLGFPYLSVRELSTASDEAATHPVAALAHLRRAEQLNPLDATAPQLGGTIALSQGDLSDARTFFAEAVRRNPGSWSAWFGAGLAESGLGNTTAAERALRQAAFLQRQIPIVREALARVNTTHPVPPGAGLRQALGTP